MRIIVPKFPGSWIRSATNHQGAISLEGCLVAKPEDLVALRSFGISKQAIMEGADFNREIRSISVEEAFLTKTSPER